MLISLIPARRNDYLLVHYECSEIVILAWDYEVLIISFLGSRLHRMIKHICWPDRICIVLRMFSRCFYKRTKLKEALIFPVSRKYSDNLATKRRNSGAFHRAMGNSACSYSHLFQLPVPAAGLLPTLDFTVFP